VRFGAGVARVDPDDGAVIAVEHPERPGMTYLLDETTEPWHTAERRWGKGFVITECILALMATGNAYHLTNLLEAEQ